MNGPGDLFFVVEAYDKEDQELIASYRTTGFFGEDIVDSGLSNLYEGDVDIIKIIIASIVVEKK